MDKMELIEELNSLADHPEKNKARMIEIAKVLLKDHYGYSRSEKEEIKKFKDRMEEETQKNI